MDEYTLAMPGCARTAGFQMRARCSTVEAVVWERLSSKVAHALQAWPPTTSDQNRQMGKKQAPGTAEQVDAPRTNCNGLHGGRFAKLHSLCCS